MVKSNLAIMCDVISVQNFLRCENGKGLIISVVPVHIQPCLPIMPSIFLGENTDCVCSKEVD